MAIFTFGSLTVDVDVEETKKFYETEEEDRCECQICRNYRKFCEYLTDEERNFFDALGIIPERYGEFFGAKEDNLNMLVMSGMYHIKGEFINKPELVAVSAEKLKELNFESPVNDYNFQIGRYELNFEINDNIACVPLNFPEPILQLNFHINIPWLLEEKYDDKPYGTSIWWKIINGINQKKEQENYHNEYIKKIHTKMIDYFEEQRIEYSELTLIEVKKYKEKWFNNFVPISKKRKAKRVCFSNKGYNNYLWHLFSYEYIKCIEDDFAVQQYLNIDKNVCYILLDYENLCFKIDRIDLLDINFINTVNDIYITDVDFTWTYVHTHELQCGPYYYKK